MQVFLDLRSAHLTANKKTWLYKVKQTRVEIIYFRFSFTQVSPSPQASILENHRNIVK